MLQAYEIGKGKVDGKGEKGFRRDLRDIVVRQEESCLQRVTH